MLRKTPLKRGTSSLKQSPMKKGKGLRAKPKTQEQKDQQREDIEKMWLLFEEHWNKEPHRCTICSRKLYGDNLSVYHHHVLAKGIERYKHLKYEIGNLQIVCWECHSGIENGSINNDKQVERVKIKYGV